jgi:hypothetical protein
MENVVKGLDGGKAGDNGEKPRKAIKRERDCNQDIRICGVCRECFDGGIALGYHMRSQSHLMNAAKRYLQNHVDQILPDSANSNLDGGGEHLTRGKSYADHLLKTGKRSD